MNYPSVETPAPAIESEEQRPSLILGILGGTATMFIAAAVWGAVTYFTNYKIGWIAIGLGFAVGFGVKGLGRGKSVLFGLIAGVLSLIGCMLGNLLFYCGILAREYQMGLVDVLTRVLTDPGIVMTLFRVGFDVMDILFYGLAAYFGFQTVCGKQRTAVRRPA